LDKMVFMRNCLSLNFAELDLDDVDETNVTPFTTILVKNLCDIYAFGTPETIFEV
jgi:hypothetical protein